MTKTLKQKETLYNVKEMYYMFDVRIFIFYYHIILHIYLKYQHTYTDTPNMFLNHQS